VKPKSSREASLESFIVCHSFLPPAGFIPTMIDISNSKTYGMKWGDKASEDHQRGIGANTVIIPFLACGDLQGCDPPYMVYSETTQQETTIKIDNILDSFFAER